MVQSLRTKSDIAVSPQACVYLAFMLLAFPLPWLLAAVIAAAFHEACHYAAIVLTGGDVRGIRLGSGGIVSNLGIHAGNCSAILNTWHQGHSVIFITVPTIAVGKLHGLEASCGSFSCSTK